MQQIAKWSVLVVYQEARTREAAVRVCDALVRRFWASANFDIRWVGLQELEEKTFREVATELAVNAHLIVVSIDPDGPLPKEAKEWMESWVDRRAEKEGAAIIGVGEQPYLSTPAAANFRFLRHLAHRAGMDYLTEIPQFIGSSFPDESGAYTSRAETMTKLMGQILSKPLTPHEPHRHD